MSEYKLPEGFKKITLQDVFNAGWQAFIVEDQPPAVDVNGDCRYLTADGKKCAVGLCIPDGHDAQQCEYTWREMSGMYPELWDIDEEYVNLDFFQRRMHDSLQNHGKWKRGKQDREAHYRAMAARYNLTIPGE